MLMGLLDRLLNRQKVLVLEVDDKRRAEIVTLFRKLRYRWRCQVREVADSASLWKMVKEADVLIVGDRTFSPKDRRTFVNRMRRHLAPDGVIVVNVSDAFVGSESAVAGTSPLKRKAPRKPCPCALGGVVPKHVPPRKSALRMRQVETHRYLVTKAKEIVAPGGSGRQARHRLLGEDRYGLRVLLEARGILQADSVNDAAAKIVLWAACSLFGEAHLAGGERATRTWLRVQVFAREFARGGEAWPTHLRMTCFEGLDVLEFVAPMGGLGLNEAAAAACVLNGKEDGPGTHQPLWDEDRQGYEVVAV